MGSERSIEEIVATAIHGASKQCVLSLDECLAEGTCAREARAVVAALAGLLLPSGGETREEWAAAVDMGDGFRVWPWICPEEAAVDAYIRPIVKPKRKVSRIVHVGPWRPVDTEETKP